ncbi:unnamed protein product [Parajaminaea phylloscopi]
MSTAARTTLYGNASDASVGASDSSASVVGSTASTVGPASTTNSSAATTVVPSNGSNMNPSGTLTTAGPIITGRPAGVPPLGVRDDTTHHASLFIGDLSPEVNDATLRAAFAAFHSLSECRVMYDPNTGRSRGYGFASFGDAEDAHRALSTLNGEWLGSRPLRINWANQKTHTRSSTHDSSGVPLTYEQILAASPVHNTTVYVGNLHPMTTQPDIVSLFQNISFVREVRLQAERGYGFAVLDTHEAAATAIHQLVSSNVQLHGRALRVSWGKDRNEGVIAHAGVAGLAGIPGVFGGVMYGLQQPLAYGAGFALPTTGFGPQAAALPTHHQSGASALNGVFSPSSPYVANVAGLAAAHQQQAAAVAAAAAAANQGVLNLGFQQAHAQHQHQQLQQMHTAAGFGGLGGGAGGMPSPYGGSNSLANTIQLT